MGLIYNTGPYNAAAKHFGADDSVHTKLPRQSFQFSVQFILNENVAMGDDSFGRNFTFYRVSSVAMPDFDYEVRPMNQYNRMRYIPTKMTPGAVNIMFYDTKDNQFQTLMKAYAGHYFHGNELGESPFNGYSTTNADYENGSFQVMGAKAVPDNARFFFEEIRIHNHDTAQGGRTFRLYNCMMLNSNHDRADYSNSGPLQYTANFQPEHVDIFPLNDSRPNSEKQSAVTGNTTASTVANRPNSVDVGGGGGSTGDVPTLQPFTGTLKPGEKIRNIDGKSFVVPAN